MSRCLLCLAIAVSPLIVLRTLSAELIITEIMYDPDGSEPHDEWVEIYNTSQLTVDIGGFFLDDEDSGTWGSIAPSTDLGSESFAVLFNPSVKEAPDKTAADFRDDWSVSSDTVVVGVSWGSLANSPSSSNEILVLRDGGSNVVDTVNYDNSGDWPSNSSSPASIYLTDFSLDNNDGSNWEESVITVSSDGTRHPGGSFYSVADVGSPGSFGAASSGSSTAAPEPGSFLLFGATLGAVGMYLGVRRISFRRLDAK